MSKNTNCKANSFCNYDIKVHTNKAETKAFSDYISSNGFNRSKRLLMIIAQVILFVVSIICAHLFTIIIKAQHLGGGLTFIILASYVCCVGFINLKLLDFIYRNSYSFKKSDIEGLIVPCVNNETSDENYSVEYSIGMNGVTVKSENEAESENFNYKDAKRVIECELGIIMIHSDSILCIPARYFNDESACFITKRLKKYRRNVYKTMGLMKICRD